MSYRKHWTRKLTSGTQRANLGAASELQVCADFLHKGYHVFRSESPHCPCDLLIMNPEGIISRVEVRTGNRNAKTGKLSALRHGNYDVLAIVIENEIIYEWKSSDQSENSKQKGK